VPMMLLRRMSVLAFHRSVMIREGQALADLAPCHPSNEGSFKVPQTVSFPSNSVIAGGFTNRFN
jgi:hypothetical protein